MAEPPRPIPVFTPVRAREDGWTPERRREFIRLLHVGGKTGPSVRRGEQVGTITRPDNAATLELLDRFERKVRDSARRRAFRDRRRGIGERSQ